MKVIFEIEDCPSDLNYPISYWIVSSNGIKKGPFCMNEGQLVEFLMTKSEGLEHSIISSPILPENVLRYEKTAGQHIITIVVEKQSFFIRYGNKEPVELPFPKMVVKYRLLEVQGGYRVTQIKVAAVSSSEKLTDDTQLHYFPFTNVCKEDHVVCWGENEKANIKDFSELEQVFKWFIASPFGEDYGCRTTHGIALLVTLMERIQGKEFDDSWLVPAPFSLSKW